MWSRWFCSMNWGTGDLINSSESQRSREAKQGFKCKDRHQLTCEDFQPSAAVKPIVQLKQRRTCSGKYSTLLLRSTVPVEFSVNKDYGITVAECLRRYLATTRRRPHTTWIGEWRDCVCPGEDQTRQTWAFNMWSRTQLKIYMLEPFWSFLLHMLRARKRKLFKRKV